MSQVRSFRRLFIANRGEVAARVARTCDALGITPVFAVSEADKDAPYVTGREKVVIGPARSSQSYLDPTRVVQAAVQSRCTALHPGWGFLAENSLFASLCEAHGVTFIGPPAHVMRLMGTKTPAKHAMGAAGLTLIPGSDGVLGGLSEARDVARRIGYPVLLKAESGGGGRGMRIARKPDELETALSEASSESQAAFGDRRVYMEKLIEGGRHIEIQLMADRHGNVVHYGERDCTIQRNHQKLIEESPAPTIAEEERQRTLRTAVQAAARIGYVGAGTMEFLLDGEGILRFMEMNTRLQVEHSVTEMLTGADLVAEQIAVAAGARLARSQEQIKPAGHAIECRINAEDPHENFRPTPGVIRTWRLPDVSDGNLRIDSHVVGGYEVPPHYDSLLCKMIARGDTRQMACARLIRGLEGLVCEGVSTTASMHRSILRSEAFQNSAYDTRAIPGWS